MLLTHLTKSEIAFMQISGVFVHSLHLFADNFNFHWDFFSSNLDFVLTRPNCSCYTIVSVHTCFIVEVSHSCDFIHLANLTPTYRCGQKFTSTRHGHECRGKICLNCSICRVDWLYSTHLSSLVKHKVGAQSFGKVVNHLNNLCTVLWINGLEISFS